MSRNLGLTGGRVTHSTQVSRPDPQGATQYTSAEIIRLADRRHFHRGQSDLAAASQRGSFIRAAKQWAIDLLAIAAWCLLTIVTAAGIVVSVFLLFSPV